MEQLIIEGVHNKLPFATITRDQELASKCVLYFASPNPILLFPASKQV